MHKLIAVPRAAVAPIHRNVRQAVKTRRLGNVKADYGLDALNFFLADVQTGFGPFIAVYLYGQQWTAAEVGTALGVGTVTTMVAQIPAGAAIDAIPAKRLVAFAGLLAVFASALLLALFPSWIPVVAAEVLHGVASVVLVPAVAAVTLSRVGRAAFAQRLGRNARFMALGNGIGAGVMGYAGAHFAAAAPFWLAAVSTIPAMLALWALPPRHETQPRAQRLGARKATAEGWRILRDKRLLAFVICVVLFHGSNAFILPLALVRLTAHVGGGSANMVLAICLVVSQSTVALFSPMLGKLADAWGRKPVLLIGFVAVPLHAVALAFLDGPYWIVALQLLDGAGAAMFGVLQPLVASDITQGTNRFNLSIGVLGLAAGLGATLSSVGGGQVVTRFGETGGFFALAGVGVAAVLALLLLMPETHDDENKRKNLHFSAFRKKALPTGSR